jgi:hypothetical protein
MSHGESISYFFISTHEKHSVKTAIYGILNYAILSIHHNIIIAISTAPYLMYQC